MLSHTFNIGSLTLPNRLIQGPLAGYSCAPFRTLFNAYKIPAYCVSEMVSAHDVIYKHLPTDRYLYRHPDERLLCYQLAGHDPELMADAAYRLETLGADLIDINCGCPKPKIRKKGAGSALLEQPQQLQSIIRAIKRSIRCPLTVKIRLQGGALDIPLAKSIEEAGADALIVHGRRWIDDYDHPNDWLTIGQIKQALTIPVIGNGNIENLATLKAAIEQSHCDAFMISRASTGKPWLFQVLLSNISITPDLPERIALFINHLQGLALLENEFKAVLQGRSLVRYYFKPYLDSTLLNAYYQCPNLESIRHILNTF